MPSKNWILCLVLVFTLGAARSEAQTDRAAGGGASSFDPQSGLIAHWPLGTDLADQSAARRPVEAHGTIPIQAVGPEGDRRIGAAFNGRDSWLEVPAQAAPDWKTDDFSITVRVRVPDSQDDVPGDILSHYDPLRRCGIHLSLKSSAVTTSLANANHLQFSIDNNQAGEWTDCGRPGQALLAFALAVHDGALYAGTCEPGRDQSGHVYRYEDGQKWIDCGAPDQSNSVTALAVYNGKLYAGTGKYRVAGSSLPESENTTLGGRIFRYEGDRKWAACGQLPETEAIGGLIVFRGRLYASSLYRPAGFYVYEGDSRWSDCGTPDGKRVVALGVYNGHLYATSYDGGFVYRFDGAAWTDCGRLGENTQTYSFAVHHGRLMVGTWPSGRVYRFEELNQWTDCGRLGEELEVMGMLVHNGRLIAGTLPLAEVHEYQSGDVWKKLTRLDHTPDVKYRRAWTMAEFDGRVFCSTLPSGHIYSWQAGRTAMADRPLASGWRHVTAVKSRDRLRLYVDGRLEGQSQAFDAKDYPLSPGASLKIGFGANDVFHGHLSDLRLYRRALSEGEIRELAAQKPHP